MLAGELMRLSQALSELHQARGEAQRATAVPNMPEHPRPNNPNRADPIRPTRSSRRTSSNPNERPVSGGRPAGGMLRAYWWLSVRAGGALARRWLSCVPGTGEV